MKTTTLKLVISFFSFILFISCSKEDDAIDRNTVLLIQDSWKFETYGLDENNNGSIEESENAMLATSVPLLDRLQLKLVVAGSPILHGTAPRANTPVPFTLKVKISSTSQASNKMKKGM